MATEDPTNLLYSFRGSYGRLCHLTCKALHDAAPPGMVAEAFVGSGSQMAPVLNAIRTAFVECKEALHRAAEDYTPQEITRVAVEMRRAHEREWDVEIPTSVAA